MGLTIDLFLQVILGSHTTLEELQQGDYSSPTTTYRSTIWRTCINKLRSIKHLLRNIYKTNLFKRRTRSWNNEHMKIKSQEANNMKTSSDQHISFRTTKCSFNNHNNNLNITCKKRSMVRPKYAILKTSLIYLF